MFSAFIEADAIGLGVATAAEKAPLEEGADAVESSAVWAPWLLELPEAVSAELTVT